MDYTSITTQSLVVIFSAPLPNSPGGLEVSITEILIDVLYTTVYVIMLVVIIRKEVSVKVCGRAAGYLVRYSDTGSVLVQ